MKTATRLFFAITILLSISAALLVQRVNTSDRNAKPITTVSPSTNPNVPKTIEDIKSQKDSTNHQEEGRTTG